MPDKKNPSVPPSKERARRLQTVHTAAPRPLDVIAREIKAVWPKVYFGAVPYLDAMCSLKTTRDVYGCDPGEEIVTYFLSNASGWRGDDAKRIKAELKAHLGR